MIDDDGNVAIMDFADEGAQPSYMCDERVVSLLFGNPREDVDELFALSKSQKMDLLLPPVPPTLQSIGDFCVVRVERPNVDLFKRKVEAAFDRLLCIDEEESLYFIENNRYKADREKVVQALIDDGLIESVYRIKDFSSVFEKPRNFGSLKGNFDSAPYYIYSQKDGIVLPQKRLNVPTDPVKEEQLTDWVRNTSFRVEGKFSEMPYMQIAAARFCLENNHYKAMQVGNFIYELRYLNAKERGYCVVNYLKFDFLLRPYFCYFFSIPPRLLILSGDKKVTSFANDDYRPFFLDAFWLSYEMGEDWVQVEKICRMFKPHAILCLEGSLADQQRGEVLVDDVVYPLFYEAEIWSREAELLSLIHRPYRGEPIRTVIPEAEMLEMEKRGEAKKYAWCDE